MEPNPQSISNQPSQTPLSVPPQTPTHAQVPATSMWDAFEHILMFISLYFLTGAVISSCYFFIGKWFPDTTEIYYQGSYPNNFVQLYFIAILITEPFFAFLFLNITKRTLQNPHIRMLKMRRVLIYLTLIVAFIFLLAFCVALIYNLLTDYFFLSGILRSLTAIVIFGIIFLFYFHQVKEDRTVS